MRLRRGLSLVLLCLVGFLSGCAPFVDQDQISRGATEGFLLVPGDQIGQTFVAHHGGLSGIEFLIAPQPGTQGVLRLELSTGPGAEPVITTASIDLSAGSSAAFHRLAFEPLRDSHGSYYYASLTFEGSGGVFFSQAGGDAYLHGALYRNDAPEDAQAAFRLAYDPLWMALEVGGAFVDIVGALGIALLLYVLPGWALLAWLWPASSLSWVERLALSVGVSLALYPLLLLWTDAAGLHLGPLYAWLPVLLGGALLAWRYRRWRPRCGRDRLLRWWSSSARWPDIVMVLALLLVFGVRLVVVRTLEASIWDDAYQHTLITQLLVNNGGLFESWEPYAPYSTLTVHVGFHTLVAPFVWLTNSDSISATLIVGQLLNGFAALNLAPLAIRIARGQRWAGVGAVVIAGLVSNLPAEYVNWGRYPQLAAQAILPVVIWFFWETAEHTPANKSALAFGSVTLAGMTLCYYRMPFFFVAFAGPWFVLYLWIKARRDRGNLGKVLLRCAVLGSLAVLLLAPLVGRASGSTLAENLERGLTMVPVWEQVREDYLVWLDLYLYVSRPLVNWALVVLVWASVWRRWEVVSVGLWIAALGSLVATRLINLPGANYMQNFAVLIVLYLPVSLLTGWSIGELARIMEDRRIPLRHSVIVVVMLALSLSGASRLLAIVNTNFILVTRPDVRAMAWINQHVPENARFLVESWRYGENSAVGTDGGWWIPLFTQRRTTMPPQYALYNEVPDPPDYSRRVKELVFALEKTSPASNEGLRLLCQEGVSHVYIGQRQGGVMRSQLFAPEDFLDRETFQPVYHEDRVFIFELTGAACAN